MREREREIGEENFAYVKELHFYFRGGDALLLSVVQLTGWNNQWTGLCGVCRFFLGEF